MNTTPDVSILVPVCNVERYLRECLDSLINQTLENIQIICIDDGSTDSSLAILEEFQRRDRRIQVLSKPNSGYGDSMNKGLELATGEYIGIVESDDFAAEEMFEELFALAEAHQVDLVKSDFYAHVTSQDKKKDKLVNNLQWCPSDQVIEPLQCREVFLTRPAIWSALYKRSFLEENDIRFLPTPGASFQDTSFNFKTMAAAKRAFLTKRAYLHYRIDNSSSSVKSQAKVFPICDEYDEIWRFAHQRPDVFEALKYLIPQIEYGGYRWNLERLIENLRYGFYERFVADFQKIQQEGLLESEYFDAPAWQALTAMLADPDGYYESTFGPIKVRSTTVARFPHLDAPVIEAAIDEVLLNLGPNDEVIVDLDVPESEQKSRLLDALLKKDPRVFSSANLFSNSLLRIIDPLRLSGESLTVYEMLPTDAESGNMGTKKEKSYALPELFDLLCPISLPLLLTPLYDEALSDSRGDAAVSDPKPLCLSGECGVAEYLAAKDILFQIGERASTLLSGSQLEYDAKKALFGSLKPLWKVLQEVHAGFSYDERLRAGDRISPQGFPAIEARAPWPEDMVGEIPDISVIIPVYNARKYLEETLESVLSQDAEIEVICIDDGSADGSWELLEEKVREEPRLRAVAQMNGGAGTARNRGIEMARGSYLAFIDADDLYPTTGTLSKLLDAARGNDALMCGGSLALINPDGSPQTEHDPAFAYCTFHKERFVTLEEYGNDYGWIRFLYKASLFEDGKVRFPGYYWYEDPVFFLRAARGAGRLYEIPDLTYLYRVDHKEATWSALQMRDLLRGAAENLTATADMKLDAMYSQIILRLDYDYCRPIVDHIDDDEVLMRLVSIQSSLEPSLLNFVTEKGKVSHILRALEKGRGAEAMLLERVSHKIVTSKGYKALQDLYRKVRGTT